MKKKFVNFGPITPEITRLIFSHPNSVVRVLRMLMHLSAGHVTATGEFYPLPPQKKIFSPVGLGAPSGLTLGVAANF